jgi:hypothetical protein
MHVLKVNINFQHKKKSFQKNYQKINDIIYIPLKKHAVHNIHRLAWGPGQLSSVHMC